MYEQNRVSGTGYSFDMLHESERQSLQETAVQFQELNRKNQMTPDESTHWKTYFRNDGRQQYDINCINLFRAKNETAIFHGEEAVEITGADDE